MQYTNPYAKIYYLLLSMTIGWGATLFSARAQGTAGFDSLLVKREAPKGSTIQSTVNEQVLFYVSRPLISVNSVGRKQYWQRVQTDATKRIHVQLLSQKTPPDSDEAKRQRRQAWEAAFSYLWENRTRVIAKEILDVEPDMLCPLLGETPQQPVLPSQSTRISSSTTGYESGKMEMSFWPTFDGPEGYLSDKYSGLMNAYQFVSREKVDPAKIAILDIGFLSRHAAFPAHADLPPADMTDPNRSPSHGHPGEPYFPPPHAFNGPAHGTATAAILAGPHRPIENARIAFFSGGNPDAKIIPIRIGHSVAAAPLPWFFSSVGDIALGFVTAADSGAEILSMSVGGTPSRALADAVNQAYYHGVAMFCATGDFVLDRNTSLHSPWYIVYPAAFGNVMGVCGVTAGRKPYGQRPDNDLWKGRITLGSFGPEKKMRNVVAGWGPNIPWAQIPIPDASQQSDDPWNTSGPWNKLDLDGGGTSANTPQVAAAASLVLEHNRGALAKAAAEWQRVEAIYQILRDSADKADSKGKELFFGNGFLRAHEAVKAPVPDFEKLEQHTAEVGFYWLEIIASALITPPSSDTEADLRPKFGQVVQQLLPDLTAGLQDSDNSYPAAIASAAELEIAQVIADSDKIQKWLDSVPNDNLASRRTEFINLILSEELSSTARRLLEAILKTTRPAA